MARLSTSHARCRLDRTNANSSHIFHKNLQSKLDHCEDADAEEHLRYMRSLMEARPGASFDTQAYLNVIMLGGVVVSNAILLSQKWRCQSPGAAGEEHYLQIVMPLSLRLTERCDGVLRIGGPSQGADGNVATIWLRLRKASSHGPSHSARSVRCGRRIGARPTSTRGHNAQAWDFVTCRARREWGLCRACN
jgi:hypothetical protein